MWFERVRLLRRHTEPNALPGSFIDADACADSGAVSNTHTSAVTIAEFLSNRGPINRHTNCGTNCHANSGAESISNDRNMHLGSQCHRPSVRSSFRRHVCF